MDLIVSRNSIFCHSPGPGCSHWGPYQQRSGCGIEHLSSASDQTTRKSDSELTGVRRRWAEGQGGRRVRDKIWRCLRCIIVMRPPTQRHTRTLAQSCRPKACSCSQKGTRYAYHMRTVKITHESTHCVEGVTKPIDGTPSGEGFIYALISSVISLCSGPVPKKSCFFFFF